MQDTPQAQRCLVLQGLGAMLLPLPFAAFAEDYPTKQLVQKVGIKS